MRFLSSIITYITIQIITELWWIILLIVDRAELKPEDATLLGRVAGTDDWSSSAGDELIECCNEVGECSLEWVLSDKLSSADRVP